MAVQRQVYSLHGQVSDCVDCFTTKLWLGWEKEYVNRNKMDWDRLGKKRCDKTHSWSSFFLPLLSSLNDIGIVIGATGIIGNLVMRLSSGPIAGPTSLEFMFDWIRWLVASLLLAETWVNLEDEKYQQLLNISIRLTDSLMIPGTFITYLRK